MMMIEGIILGHYLSVVAIQVNPGKVEVILRITTPKTQKEVCSFLRRERYYRRFIEKIPR